MQLRFIWVGSIRNTRFAEVEDDYLRRIQHFIPCERVSIREVKKTDPRARSAGLNREEEWIRQKLKDRTYLIALDESGRELTSEGLSQFLNQLMVGSTDDVVFVCGGHSGLSENVLAKSDFRLALSRFTLPHELARILLLEQLYRALSILKGLPYHR